MPKVTIPVGPQHPALKEPINFMVTVDGETIVDADMNLAYSHRGMEKLAESKTYLQNIYLVERICGICSHTHTTCFVQGVEELMGIEVPERGLYIRTLVAELERIHSHLLWTGVAGHEIGFDTLFMYTWRDRELALDLLEMITGNRVNYGINTIGGVRRNIKAGMKDQILKHIGKLEERVQYYTDMATTESTVLLRAEGVGHLPENEARKFCAVGPTARASNIPTDVRKEDPYAAYEELDFELITSDSCDILGRLIVRMQEMVESCKMARQLIENLPSGPIRAPMSREVPAGEVVSRYEAPRGECLYYVKSNGTFYPERLKVRASTYANWPAVVYSLKGYYIADIPLIIAAIDPCMSCTSRVAILDTKDGNERKVLDMDYLRTYGIKWYKEHGRGVRRR